MAKPKTASWRRFFEAYAKASNGADVHAIAESYAENFIAAGPKGSASFKNDDNFLDWLQQVQAFNKQTGLESLKVAEVEEIPVSREYVMIKVTWNAVFQKLPGTPISFEISYIVQQTGDKPEIVMYISHNDQETVMKAKGLI